MPDPTIWDDDDNDDNDETRDFPFKTHDESHGNTGPKKGRGDAGDYKGRAAPGETPRNDNAYPPLSKKEERLFKAIEENDHRNVKNLLIDPELNPNCQKPSGKSPLHQALRLGNINIIKILCDNILLNINIQNDKSDTPLMVAMLYGEEEVFSYLLDRKADIRFVNNGGDNILELGCQQYKLNFVKLLMNHPDLEPLKRNKNGRMVFETSEKNIVNVLREDRRVRRYLKRQKSAQKKTPPKNDPPTAKTKFSAPDEKAKKKENIEHKKAMNNLKQIAKEWADQEWSAHEDTLSKNFNTASDIFDTVSDISSTVERLDNAIKKLAQSQDMQGDINEIIDIAKKDAERVRADALRRADANRTQDILDGFFKF